MRKTNYFQAQKPVKCDRSSLVLVLEVSRSNGWSRRRSREEQCRAWIRRAVVLLVATCGLGYERCGGRGCERAYVVVVRRGHAGAVLWVVVRILGLQPVAAAARRGWASSQERSLFVGVAGVCVSVKGFRMFEVWEVKKLSTRRSDSTGSVYGSKSCIF